MELQRVVSAELTVRLLQGQRCDRPQLSFEAELFAAICHLAANGLPLVIKVLIDVEEQLSENVVAFRVGEVRSYSICAVQSTGFASQRGASS